MDRKAVMKVAITTLGCKANQYDSFAIEDVIKDNNLSVVPFSEEADAYIINTCTVTGRTDFKSRYLIRKARKTNPDAVIIVTGCYAQVSSNEVKGIKGVDYVIGNAEKDTVLNLIYKGKQDTPEVMVSGLKLVPTGSKQGHDNGFNLRAQGSSERTRAFLKVQDGCERYCSYCIIPYARGITRSLPADDVIREIELLRRNGYREIVLTGIHLGSYGITNDSAAHSLTELIKDIDKRSYHCRFRISSLDPDEVTDELIEIVASSKRICNHFHLAVQSCDDDILMDMNRHHYSRNIFVDKVERIYKLVNDVSIGVDIIVGFPGETDTQFMNTYSTLKELPVSYFHIFPFSKRKGTPAFDFSNQVDDKVMADRCSILKKLAEEKKRAFYTIQVGKYADVLIESISAQKATGKSRNYIPVVISGKKVQKNTEIKIRLKEVRGKEVFGIYEG